jgi:hypothetical protein
VEAGDRVLGLIGNRAEAICTILGTESAVVGVKVARAGGEDEVKACAVPEAGAEIDLCELLD